MFGFFKKKQPEAKPPSQQAGDRLGPGGPVISIVLLESESFPVEAFLKTLASSRIQGKPVTNIQHRDGAVFSFDVGDEFLALSAMPAPYPAGDLEGPIATALLWPKEPSIETVKRHRTFLLITMTGGSADPIRRRLVLTAVTAAAAKQPGVAAVYWPEATQIIYPPLFVDMAESINTPEAPPLHLWVDMRMFPNPDRTVGLFTTGLAPLGHMEIEIPRIAMPPGELREWLVNIIFYLLENGPVLKDGQTIGMTADQKIRILHRPSSFGHSGKVIRLEP
jgi:hypothetical protein